MYYVNRKPCRLHSNTTVVTIDVIRWSGLRQNTTKCYIVYDGLSEVETLVPTSENIPNTMYKKRSRIQYTKQQLDILESTFQLHHYPTVDMVDNTAERLTLPTEKISVWFQNRRSKLKKELKYSKVSSRENQQLIPPSLSPTCLSTLAPPPRYPMSSVMNTMFTPAYLPQSVYPLFYSTNLF
ncbi:unnamed protein product [Didymodactylos carnosus]|uniref:Homeobox domain-containing protein n=1 Tax=Didymodactylos carnosus TaxID=1234261 RepID=A0A8S2WJ75_9BILA|nr:unnamed protein product [Didymodactylos carnosus]CAF4444148.1 unnamed protein product [Didymodactylos carnosus]